MGKSFRERLSDLGFASYDEYLQSDHWKELKKAYRESGKPVVCQCCGGPKVQFHHICYLRLGEESLKDILPLCRKCHKAVHRKTGELFLKLSDVKEAIKAVQRGPGYLPAYKKLTKHNSTRKQRKAYQAKKKVARRILQEKARGLPGQLLVQCDVCGKRGWQHGVYCCLCGEKCSVLKSNH